MNSNDKNTPDAKVLGLSHPNGAAPGPATEAADPQRPFGYWLMAADRLMAAEFGRAFAAEGLTRRDWRLLNRIDGTVDDGHPVRGPRLRPLAERGWIERTADGWALTASGREAKARLGGIADGIRRRVAGTLTPEEFATLSAALEKLAREFGWQEGVPLPRRERGHGRHSHRPHRHGGHHDGRHGDGPGRRGFDLRFPFGFGHGRDC